MLGSPRPRARGAVAWSAPLVFVGLIAPATLSFAGDDAVVDAASVPEAQVVAKDPVTGQLRPATADEIRALHQSHAALRRHASPTQLQARTHWSGARGARLTDEFLNYSVVVKRSDGQLVELCVQGREAAEKVQEASSVAKSAELPTE